MNHFAKTVMIGLLLLGSPSSALKTLAQEKEGDKCTEKTEDKKKEDEKEVSDYDKLFKDKKTETAKSAFLTLHKFGNKVYAEFPLKNVNREILLGATVSSTSDGRFVTVGFKSTDPIHFKYEVEGKKLIFKKPNAIFLEDSGASSSRKRALALNYGDPKIFGFDIEAYTPDSTAVVVNLTELLARPNSAITVIPEYSGNLKVSTSPKSELSFVKSIKAFDTNASVRVEFNYMVSAFLMDVAPVVTDYPLSVEVTFSMLMLPEKKMTPRVADARIGYFSSRKSTFSRDKEYLADVYLAHRWNLVPSDVAAYASGGLSEPVTPITFYLDSVFPTAWKEPLKKGILRWNKAFEKIGFKDAIRVREFPTKEEDPEFDPDNLKYSCIRYVPTSTENAMGPSWVDPLTGEILNASVLVYNNVENLLYKWRLTQTAAVDPRVRGNRLPKEVFDESLEYVIAHEVGHTLGLMHNMGASSAYRTDDLRSASFTRKNGTTPSIMDYARFNYVAQPKDKGVSLTPPDLGAYDYYAIDWGYRYFPSFPEDMNRQAKELEAFVDEKTKNPLYRYKPQQLMGYIIDPFAVAEDLGDDPLKSSEYGIKNLRYIQKHFSEWITDDEDSERKKEIDLAIAQQYHLYVKNVMNQVGGIDVNIAKESSDLPRYRVLPRRVQRESFLWTMDQVKHFTDYADRDFERRNRLEISYYDQLLEFLVMDLFRLRARVLTASHLDPERSYGEEEFHYDLFEGVFSNTLAGRPLSPSEEYLEKAYVDNAIGYVVTGSNKGGVSMPSALTVMPENLGLYRRTFSVCPGDFFARTDEVSPVRPKTGDPQASDGKVAFGNPDGNIYPVFNLEEIDHAERYFYDALLRLKPILEKRVMDATGTGLRAHYALLLHKIKGALDRNE